MSHIITESCIACRYTDCVEVCPVDCFHIGPNFMAIDPDECIDCGLCISECPVNAIQSQFNLTPKEKIFIKINQELSSKWPIVKTKQLPLANADQFSITKEKLSLLKNY